MKLKKPIVLETFRDIGNYEVSNLAQEEPSCFNSMVRVRKYRVTVELIDEPLEIIQKRIQALYDDNRNTHHWGPLMAKAKEYNYEIKENK